ncbi:MAG: tripartite tricarboxylate transporter substrate binding protein [Pigmentiphaga sp.]|uniref:Bug family tripartite tricarboxylate transporter substrate binding protein n=1 Tax=Pigmentiphaga sp. TaxID=1977564 RepID=UPI0029B18C40|nr:tripartite tricarboxylate transporter substrate binding protein [Pigmentiphaga sp.]MDX3907159.1 tripartite tricarboxylate transporter substrate binding protein [Pigmentiphaga sp.]
MKRIVARSVSLAAAVAAAAAAGAETFPSRPIKVVVPFTAGGNADTVARILTQELSRQLGQGIVIDNRGGANGIIGSDIVAKAPPDGYTLLFTTGSHAINPIVSDKLPYDTVKDFAPVALVGVTGSHVLVVPPSSPFKTLQQLVEAGRKPDSKLSFGSAGVGNTMHLVGEYFKMLTGTHLLHVPYRGSAPAVNALMAGEVQLVFLNPVGAVEQVKQGNLRALAVSGDGRLAQLPDVPTMAEAGLPQFDLNGGWQGLFAPGGTPLQVIATLNEKVNQALKTPAVSERLQAIGMQPAGGPPQALADYVRQDMKKFSEIAKAADIRPR